MDSFPFPSENSAAHGLLRLLKTGMFVIELTSVKKGLSPFPFFYIVCPNRVTLRLQTCSLNEM